jgi:hypothetical protein
VTTIIYEYEIPDPDQPIPEEERRLGPSGVLRPFAPPPVSPEQVIGRTAEEICANVGTYGMGGPGFFGLRMGSDWLVIAVWGAGDWMVAQGRYVKDMRYHERGRPRPWITAEGDELSAQLVGRKIRSIEVQPYSFRIVFDNGFDLAIEEAWDHRPVFEGNKKPRQFTADDDLRRAVFLSPTTEIWV